MASNRIEPKATLNVDKAQLRTPEDIRGDANKRAPDLSPDTEPAAMRRMAAAARSGGQPSVKQFLPTISPSQYVEQKQVSASKRASGKRAAEASGAATRAAPAPAAIGISFEGAVNVDGRRPPDTHGAVGPREFVETTNSHIDIFEKATPATRTSVSMAAFFNYFDRPLFDARAVFDSDRQRWLITADARAESPTLQRFFIAVSTGDSALGPYFIYNVNVDFFQNNNFWDYPQLGIDRDAVIITANIFPAAGGFAGADMFAVPKDLLYSGLGFSVPVYVGLEATLAPPIVFNQGAESFLIAAPGGNTLKLYELRDSGLASISLSGPFDVPVDPYAIPVDAGQPGTAATLDVLDGRFVNASTQLGNLLWQVHTVDLSGLPTPRFYQIDAAARAVVQSGHFFASPVSFDFNASIASNPNNKVFVTWTSTDPPAGINAQMRVASSNGAVAAAFGSGLVAFTSPRSYGGGRWGDYSAVTIDPSDPNQAWAVNETIQENIDDWSSRIASVD